MNIHNKTIIVLILLVIVILIFSLWIYVLPQLDTINQSENNQQQLPAGVIEEIENTRSDEYSFFNRWEANYTEQTVTIYLNCTSKSRKRPNIIVDNWTIRWETDPEMYNETAMDVSIAYIHKWDKDHPQQEVCYWTQDDCRKTVHVVVTNITPEIKRTHVLVEGWKIDFLQAKEWWV